MSVLNVYWVFFPAILSKTLLYNIYLWNTHILLCMPSNLWMIKSVHLRRDALSNTNITPFSRRQNLNTCGFCLSLKHPGPVPVVQGTTLPTLLLSFPKAAKSTFSAEHWNYRTAYKSRVNSENVTLEARGELKKKKPKEFMKVAFVQKGLWKGIFYLHF